MSALRSSLRRLTAYSTLGGLCLAAVAVLEEVVSELLETGMGIDSLQGSVLAGLTIALVLVPAHATLLRLSRPRSRAQAAPSRAQPTPSVDSCATTSAAAVVSAPEV